LCSYTSTSCILSGAPDVVDVDIQLSQQRFEGRPDGPGMLGFHFLRFLQNLSAIAFVVISPCLSRDSGPSYDTLNLADVADVLLANSVSQSIASDAS
jgi:hypothetical protein